VLKGHQQRARGQLATAAAAAATTAAAAVGRRVRRVRAARRARRRRVGLRGGRARRSVMLEAAVAAGVRGRGHPVVHAFSSGGGSVSGKW
jgi:hypothetical protein